MEKTHVMCALGERRAESWAREPNGSKLQEATKKPPGCVIPGVLYGLLR